MRITACCETCVVSCLSRMHRKGARPVLRGGGAGDSTSLPDPSKLVLMARAVCGMSGNWIPDDWLVDWGTVGDV